MVSDDLQPFPRGAEWLRADFHLHTIKDPGVSRKPFREEYRGREQDFCKDWIARLKDEGVRVAVVTNHNHFDRDEYKNLRKLGAKEGILVLPGVELGVKDGGGGIHTLIVFNPDGWVFNPENDDRINNRFLHGQFNGAPDEGSRTRGDFCECLKILDGIGSDYFVVFAHVQSSNGLFNELDGGNLAHFIDGCGKRWRERVLGFDQVTRPDLISPRWPTDLPMPAAVEGSDPKRMADVGRDERKCFVKIGEPTFESVKFALHDWQQRVCSMCPPPEPIPRPRLHRVRFTGGLLDGQQFDLSNELTCLIGSRGSGKSSVVECLRYALGLEAGESDLKYKNGLISGMLANGGEVTVTGLTADGSNFEIRRPIGYDPVVRLEGKDTRLRPVDILPGLLYFGQKDLGHRHPGFEDGLFEKLIGRPTLDERTREETQTSAVKRAVESFRSVLRAREKESEYAAEAEKLGHQLAVYRDKGVEKQLVRLTTFDTDKRNLMEFIGLLQTLRGRLENSAEDWEEVASEWPTLKSEVLSEVSDRLLKAKEAFTKIRSEHAELLDRLDQLLVELREQLGGVLEKERELQEDFAALQREIDAPGLNLADFRAQKSRHEQLLKLLKAAGNRKEMADQALLQVEDSARVLHDFWREGHRDEHYQVESKNELLPETLRLETEFEGNRDDFRAFLKGQFAGSGFRSTSIDKLVDGYRNGYALFAHRGEVVKSLEGSADATKFGDVLQVRLEDFLTYRVPDKRSIWFNEVPIQNLSLGQRATALLQLLMSLEDHPLFLIDQPEDDLDNETIFRNVVEPLLERKHLSQFIVATHNPNIPVLGDAELVHACRELDKGRYGHSSGSLDASSTRNAIVSIMEGGAQAFEQRQKIYSQWTNSL